MDKGRPGRVKGNLLVVEDDLSSRQTLEALLTDEEYEVRFAPNGQTALMFAGEDPPELILLDIRLPDIDGFQVCQRLKEDPQTGRIPVIFISGLEELVDKVKGFAAGGVDYITKPFRGEELLARVETHLALSRLQRQVGIQNEQLQREIDKCRRAEQALQETHDELEKRVRERTADLARTNEQLVASEKSLAERLRFETLLSEISARFVNLPTERVDGEIEDVQRRVCEILDIDRSSLWLAPEEGQGTILLAHIHGPLEGPVPEPAEAQDLFPWTMQKVLSGDILVFSKIDDLPPEAERDQASYRLYGTKSSVVVPLSAGGGEVFGLLTFGAVRRERDWPETVSNGLRLIAQVFANVLARKRSEEALRESGARLSLAAASGGVGLWSMRLRDGRIWGTEKGWELLGLSPGSQMTAEGFFNMLHPEDRDRVRGAMEQAVQSGKEVSVEYRIVMPDGNVRWRVSRSRPHFDPSGEADRLTGATIDVTERKQMEAQIKTRLREIEDLKQRLERENIYLREEINLQHLHEEIVGQSEVMKNVLFKVEQVSLTDSTVLIHGETGTGKELLARAIHRLSKRKERPLVTVNCASLPPTLIESELFGREKGAYTGALTRMVGRFELADEATLFLDEIGEIPPEIQSKLLRILEEGQFERLGSAKTYHVNARIIAATNRDLAREVSEGRFRKDLFYRLNVFPITIPPLRERPEDIPLLVWTFVHQFEKRMGKRIDTISRKKMEALQRYPWPGNVRELRNAIEHAMIVSGAKALVVELPPVGSAEAPNPRNLEDMERGHILSVLEKVGWRIAGSGGAAEVLGLNRTTLQFRMKKLGITRPTLSRRD
jgi:formate hydrogenlyase transcriptional activator